MHHYLSAHPQIFMPRDKEPHYFATDMQNFATDMTISGGKTEKREYLELFNDACDHHKAVGEASVWYLFSETAIPTILDFNPDAKLLVFFRNPVDFVQSLHAQFAYNSCCKPDLLEAWHSAEKRSNLIAAGFFGEQMNRMRSMVPESQYRVIVHDDLCESPRREYLRVLDFLGVDDDGRMDFPTYNANKIHRSPGLARFAKRTPAPISKLWGMTKRLTGIQRLGLMHRIHAMNTKPVRRQPLDPDMRASIREAFSEDIAWLGEQLGRDFSHWR